MRISFYLLVLVFFLAVLVGLVCINYHSKVATIFPSDAPSSSRNYTSLIKHGERDKKIVALTFDADMTPKMKKELDGGKVKSWYNQKVIDILRENKVPATLFLTGMWIEEYPKEAKSLAEDPLFELGNHSYSHPAFQINCYTLGLIPDSKDKEEITKTQKLLFNLTGKENKLFRFPGGCYSKTDLNIVNSLGLTVVGWDTVSGDSFNRNTNKIISNVLGKVQNGSIVVMHMHGGTNAPKTGDALPEIIKGLRAKGFTFVKVSDLIE